MHSSENFLYLPGDGRTGSFFTNLRSRFQKGGTPYSNRGRPRPQCRFLTPRLNLRPLRRPVLGRRDPVPRGTVRVNSKIGFFTFSTVNVVFVSNPPLVTGRSFPLLPRRVLPCGQEIPKLGVRLSFSAANISVERILSFPFERDGS